MSRLDRQARDKSSELSLGDARQNWLPCLIIRLIILTIRREPSRSIWIDDPSDVSRPDRSGVDQIDAEHQATDLAVRSTSRGAPPRCWSAACEMVVDFSAEAANREVGHADRDLRRWRGRRLFRGPARPSRQRGPLHRPWRPPPGAPRARPAGPEHQGRLHGPGPGHRRPGRDRPLRLCVVYRQGVRHRGGRGTA